MSEDLVNQLTLNFLISRNQLQKLNKKLKENTDNKRRSDKEIYGERIQQLFNDLLVNQPPEDLLQEVQTGFDFFMDKVIYYLKAKDNNELLEKERNEPEVIIQDDIDFEKEERDIANGNYQENEEQEEQEDEEQEDEEQEDEEQEDEEQEDEDVKLYDEKYSEAKDEFDEKVFRSKIQIDNYIESTNKTEHNPPIAVRPRHMKINNSVGVEDIQKLPLDWFQNVRQNYKKNNIIPRRKDDKI